MLESNLTDTLSRIEDADMALEMMNMVRGQIQEQANVFLISQIRKEPDSVLQLLK